MEKNSTPIGWLNVLFIICLFLPVLVLLMMPGGTIMGGHLRVARTVVLRIVHQLHRRTRGTTAERYHTHQPRSSPDWLRNLCDLGVNPDSAAS